MAVKSEASTSDRCLQVEVPPGISIALDLPEGRGIVSTRKFSKGSEIFTDQPFCHAIKSERHDDFCTSCLSKASPICKLLLCSNCKFNRYCSKACQQKDWPIHKGECVGMANIQERGLPTQPPDTIRLVLRIMMMKKAHLGKKSKESLWPVDLLYEHGEQLRTSAKMAYDAQGAFSLIKLMCERNKHIQVCDEREVFSLLDQLAHNAFQLLNMDMVIVGEGLYILPSFLNHSCEPNCAYVFDGLKMSVRSVAYIKPGQQLYITYADLLHHPNERQEFLKNTFHFNCQCQRCSLNPMLYLDPLLISVLCTKCQRVVVNVEKLPSSLDISLCTCGESTIGELATVMRMSEEFSHLTQETKANDKGMLESLITLQTRATKVLSPYHHLSVRIKVKIFDLALVLNEYQLAFQAGRSLMPLYELYLEPSPVYALLLVKLFILLFSQDIRDSKMNIRELYRKVKKNLSITHGPSHSLSMHVQQMGRDRRVQHA